MATQSVTLELSDGTPLRLRYLRPRDQRRFRGRDVLDLLVELVQVAAIDDAGTQLFRSTNEVEAFLTTCERNDINALGQALADIIRQLPK